MDKIKKTKKHSYLLLELIVSFFLLSLFLAPMLSSPFAYVRKQKKEIKSIYIQLEKEKFLALIEEKMRMGEISWETIASSENSTVFLETHPFQIPGDKNRYEAKLFLTNGKFQTEKDITFGKLKACLKIYQPPEKKTIEKASGSYLFVLKKHSTAPHAST